MIRIDQSTRRLSLRQRGSGLPQAPAFPVRGDLSVIGPMARSAADLGLELAVVAGPDELAEGVGYKLAAAEGPMVRRLSPVERDGFERLVPRHEGQGFPKHRAGCARWRTKFA
jgi:Asp-tRNA(Asn)/Glu-tRNA(Gln) amidotransferase A subunit family amidase